MSYPIAIRAAVTVLSLLASVLVASAQSVQSQTTTAPISYSATAIHALPGQPETTGKIVKSGPNMRLEYEQNGQSLIQILRPTEGVMYVLDPKAQSFFEIRGPSVPATATDDYTTPCPTSAQPIRCQHVGNDTISGIKVERWELATTPNTRPLVMLWDSTRRQALRQDYPDGSVMAMKFKAMEQVNGRKTEHWTIEISTPNQPVNTGDWWFDPDLRVVVREDLPGGEVRRLEDISVGPVDPALFLVPEGWQKQDMPGPGPAQISE